MTIEQVTKSAAISRATFHRLVARKEIPIVKIGRSTRICQSDLDNWLANLPSSQGGNGK